MKRFGHFPGGPKVHRGACTAECAEVTLEERKAWDAYAAAAMTALGYSRRNRTDVDEDHLTAAEIADDMLGERRKRFLPAPPAPPIHPPRSVWDE